MKHECKVCALTKTMRHSFTGQHEKPTKPGEMISIDLMFILQKPILLITDNATDCTFVYILNKKLEASE